jgi:putative MFS transporter
MPCIPCIRCRYGSEASPSLQLQHASIDTWTAAPIYAFATLLFAIYISELFSIEVRLPGFCNTPGRGATILTAFVVVALFRSHGVGAAPAFMLGLLIIQMCVVLLFGNETKKRHLE